MNCFLFIFMITLTVATSNPVYDLSYKETVDLVDNFNSLKEENEKLKEANINLQEIYGKYNVMLEKFNTLEAENHKLEKVRNKLKQKFKDTKRTLEEATTKNNALKSSNEQCETECQALKSSNEQLDTEHQALKSSNEQLETEYQALKSSNEQCETEHQALKSSNEQLETEHQALKSYNEQLETEHQALKSSHEQCEKEHQALKSFNEQLETEHQAPKRQMIRPGDCEDIYASGKTNDGVYTIYPDNSPMQVYCEMSQTQGSIVIQKRYDGSLDYARTFQEYSDGFGDLTGEHWLGLSLMNRITATRRWKLRIELGSFENETRYAEYSEFKIGPAPGFQLLFDKSSYKGDAGDDLGYHHNLKFSSRDNDQDTWNGGSCSASYGNSGWWFGSCTNVMTNGMSYRSGFSIYWAGWKTGLKSATLKIKKF